MYRYAIHATYAHVKGNFRLISNMCKQDYLQSIRLQTYIYIYIYIYIYKQDLALDNLQELVRHKTQLAS